MRFAILSNFVPPSPTAIVLHRLLNTLPSDQYYFICSEPQDTTPTIASSRLDAKYYYLEAPPRRQWSSPLDMMQRVYRRLSGRFGEIENYMHLRARQINEIMQQDPCCALIACTSELVNLPVGAIACAESSVAFVPYFFDDYANHLVGWQREVAQRHESNIINQATQVIVTNEATAEEYQRRYHISKTAVVHNPALIHDLNSIKRDVPFLDKSSFNIVYSGSIYHAHYDAFRNMIRAIETLPQNAVKLHLFTSQSAETIAAEGISGECLVYHPFVHQSEIASILLEADVLFLPLAFESPIPEVVRLASPGKMGDYLGMAKPILVHAPADSFVCQYFRQHKCGIVVDQPDVALLAQVISDLMAGKIDMQRLGQRARERAEVDFAIDRIQSHFKALMQKVCQPSL